jgi:hypothetical protein
MQQHASQGIAVALAAREYSDGLEYVVLGEQEASQQTPQFGRGLLSRNVRQIVEHAAIGVKLLVLVLGKVVRLDIVAELKRAVGQRLGTDKQLDQR